MIRISFFLMEYSCLRDHLAMLRTYCDNLKQIIKMACLLLMSNA